MGVFLIPIELANLGGLTHVLSCRQQVEQPFTVIIKRGSQPQLLSSLQISQDAESDELCGGLNVDPSISSEGDRGIKMTLPIENNSPHLWRGTITLRLGKTSIPIGVGEVPPGEMRSETVELNLREGTHVLNGSLSIGP